MCVRGWAGTSSTSWLTKLSSNLTSNTRNILTRPTPRPARANSALKFVCLIRHWKFFSSTNKVFPPFCDKEKLEGKSFRVIIFHFSLKRKIFEFSQPNNWMIKIVLTSLFYISLLSDNFQSMCARQGFVWQFQRQAKASAGVFWFPPHVTIEQSFFVFVALLWCAPEWKRQSLATKGTLVKSDCKACKKINSTNDREAKAHWKSMSEYVKRWMSRVIGWKIFSFRTLFTIEMINWPEEQFPVKEKRKIRRQKVFIVAEKCKKISSMKDRCRIYGSSSLIKRISLLKACHL